MKKVAAIVLGLGVVALVAFGIVYGAEKNSGGGSSDGVSVEHEGLASTANDLEDHAAEMRRHGEDMSQAGQEAGSQRWLDQGVQLLSAARQMESIADQLRGTDRDLRLFPPDESLNIYRLRGDGNALVSAGRGLVEHANELETEANDMISEAEAAGSAELRQAAEQLGSDAGDIAAHGRSVIQAGQPLLDVADRMEASLGH